MVWLISAEVLISLLDFSSCPCILLLPGTTVSKIKNETSVDSKWGGGGGLTWQFVNSSVAKLFV